jgi:hypothetical protein
VVGVGRRQPDVDAFVPDLRSVSVDGSTVRCGSAPGPRD